MQNEISTNSIITGGKSYTGIAAIEKNAKSIISVYNTIKSSFGPMGLDKMLVNAAGEVNITNDGATILQNMVIEDPAAKILVDLATNQDKEIGDGTTGVVLLAANLVDRGYKLIESGVHPSSVVSGYRMAFNESLQFIKKNISLDVNKVDDKLLKNIIKTTLSSKILKEESDLFCDIVVSAIRSLDVTEVNKKNVYDVNDINILKHPGGSMKDSFYKNGYAMNCYLASPNMKKHVIKAKILCLDMSLQKYRLPLTATIVCNDPSSMEKIREKEVEIARNMVNTIVKSGANVVLTTRGIDDLCTKLLFENGIVAIKRCKRNDLEIISRYTGTNIYTEFFDDDSKLELGNISSLQVEQIGNDECVFFYGLKKKMGSIMLRGPNTQILEEMHRSVNDALFIVKRVLESKHIVPGGGAVEIALSGLLETFAMTVNSKEHISIYNYSEALLYIPKVLALNAGLDPNEVISKVMIEQKKYPIDKGSMFGLDVETGKINNNIEKGVIEPMVNKLKALRAATEAAISVLRINEIIVLPPSQK